MLGAVLLRGEQPLGVAVADPGRPGDRVQARARALELHVRLRRRSDHRVVAELEQEHVRGRVDPAQRAVDPERRSRRGPLRPLREHDLEGVPGADVLLAAENALLVRRLVGKANERAGDRPGRGGGHVGRCLEQRADRLGIAAQHLGDPADVVEPQQRLGHDEPADGKTRPGVGERHRRLELGDPVVADVPDDRLVQQLGLVHVDDARPAADERVAPEPPLVDRLEQEARAAGRAQAEIRPERGEEIGVEECVRGRFQA